MGTRKEAQLKKLNVKDLKALLKANKIRGYSKMSKSKLIQSVLSNNLDFSNVKSSRVKRVMTEERKQQLRDQLKRAREMKALGKPKKLTKQKKEQPKEELGSSTLVEKKNSKKIANEIVEDVVNEAIIEVVKDGVKSILKENTVILPVLRKKKRAESKVKFNDILKEIKLPDTIQKGVNMQELLGNVLDKLTDDLVRQIFSSKSNARTTKKIIKKNKTEPLDKIVEMLYTEFMKKTKTKEITDKDMDSIDKFIEKLKQV